MPPASSRRGAAPYAAILAALLCLAAGRPAAAQDHQGHQGHQPHSSPAAAEQPVYYAEGEIKTLAEGSVELRHEAVPALSWPPMTMRFKVRDQGLLEGFKPGDRVIFHFQGQGGQGGFLIVDMERRP